jgi:hypothetical protein
VRQLAKRINQRDVSSDQQVYVFSVAWGAQGAALTPPPHAWWWWWWWARGTQASATPMMIEGREGTILSAVGDERDHRVATEVLKWHQTQRMQQIADRSGGGARRPVAIVESQPRTLGRAMQPSANALRARGRRGGRRPQAGGELAARDADPSQMFSFGAVRCDFSAVCGGALPPDAHRWSGLFGGWVAHLFCVCVSVFVCLCVCVLGVYVSHHASHRHPSTTPREWWGCRLMLEPPHPGSAQVYEHRDCFGVPRYVGQTVLVPEEQFRADLDHPGVRKTLRQPRTGRQGSSEVVWAGFGTGPVGAQQMADMRMAVQHVRAVRA